MNKSYKREIVFDLNINSLKKYYEPLSNCKYTNAYNEIYDYLNKNNCKHRQGSAYFTLINLSDVMCDLFFKKLCNQFVWFPLCISKFDMPIIQEEPNRFTNYINRNFDKLIIKYDNELNNVLQQREDELSI